jgi:flavin reductase (DIM6/NTAB) family NADH-FMN oxidoreductase RutF
MKGGFMETGFLPLDPAVVQDNVFKLIGKDWMLITAGTRDSFNTMTASWGGMGVLWDKKVSFAFVRPTRYTFEFLEQSEIYTLSFLDEQYRDILMYCGTKSGRDVNKVAETSLTPVFGDCAVYFAEARLVIECRKIYAQDIVPANFLDQTIDDYYPKKDYHRMYIGEITRCLRR